jgi:site-specific DNA recombinase
LDRAKLRGGEGHHSCPGCKANDETREPIALLTAIAKAPGDGSNDDIGLGRIASFAEIVEREAQGERHIRLFAPLTFLWRHIIPAIVDGTAPADLTVTGLAKALPYSQTQQERAISRNA